MTPKSSRRARRSPPLIPLSLFAFAIFYGGMVCIAGVLGNKQVALGPLAVEAGIFAFLLLVVTSSAVAELHGRATANRLVLIGFVPLIVSLLLSLVVLALPASPDMDPARLSAFETMMGGTPRIWLGGILAYGISTFLNVTIFSRLKASEGAGLLWLRAGIASVLSQIVDTLIFITVAFYGVFPIGELLLGQMLAKVVLSAVLVPPLVYALRGARKRRLDRRSSQRSSGFFATVPENHLRRVFACNDLCPKAPLAARESTIKIDVIPGGFFREKICVAVHLRGHCSYCRCNHRNDRCGRSADYDLDPGPGHQRIGRRDCRRDGHRHRHAHRRHPDDDDRTRRARSRRRT